MANAKKKNNKKVNATKKENKVVNTKKEDIKVKVVKNDTKKVESVVKKEEKVDKVKKQGLSSKQKDLILVLLVVVLFAVALIVTSTKKSVSYFSKINYSEYEEKVNSDDTFLVVIVREGCSFCKLYEPIVKKVASKYKYPVYYIDIADITEEELNSLQNSNEYLMNNQWGTPTTLLMKGNNIIDYISGYVEEGNFEEFVLKNELVTNNE